MPEPLCRIGLAYVVQDLGDFLLSEDWILTVRFRRGR